MSKTKRKRRSESGVNRGSQDKIRTAIHVFGSIMKSFSNVNFTLLNPVRHVYAQGTYLVKTTSQLFPNLLYHFGVMIVGRRLRELGYSDTYPLVFHLTNSGFQVDWVETFGKPEILGKVDSISEPQALDRLRFASQNMNLWYVGNDCEHFARYVAEGYKQSTQFQNIGVLSGLTLAFLLLRD